MQLIAAPGELRRVSPLPGHSLPLLPFAPAPGPQKDYVQHHLEAHGAEVWGLLASGGYLYVCGDAKAMAKDVHRMLHAVIVQVGGGGSGQVGFDTSWAAVGGHN